MSIELEKKAKESKRYLAAAEDFDIFSGQSEQTDDEILESKASVRTQQSQNQTFTETTKTTATSKKDINLRLETLQKNKPDNKRITKIDDSPQTDSDYVESSDNSYKSPKIKLVIGRKEITTNETSAITESRLTVYGSQDVDITISSESRISVTTTQTSETLAGSLDSKDTPKRFKNYTIIEDELKDEEDDFNRADRKRDESVAFATKKSIHLYGSFDSNAESPATDPSVSHHVTDTGISMTRGFTETTSPGLNLPSEENIEEVKKPTLDLLEVEAEETELTDAGLSPIAADDAEMINNAFLMAAEEETHYTTTATSPVEFDEASATSEAGTITDRVETKDASSSPLDENVVLSISEVPEITDEEFLSNRRATGEVKAKVKILEEQTTKNLSTTKRRVDFEEPPKIEQYLDEKIENKQTFSELKKVFSPDKEESEEVSPTETIPPVHEVIEKIEKQISVESGKKGIETVVKQTVEKKATEVLSEIESQILHETDFVKEDRKKIDKRSTQVFKADKYHVDTENLEGIQEPVCEVKVLKKHVPNLTDDAENEPIKDEANIIKVSETVAAIESKIKESSSDTSSKKLESEPERHLIMTEESFDVLSPTDKEIIQKSVAEKICIYERKISAEEKIQNDEEKSEHLKDQEMLSGKVNIIKAAEEIHVPEKGTPSEMLKETQVFDESDNVLNKLLKDSKIIKPVENIQNNKLTTQIVTQSVITKTDNFLKESKIYESKLNETRIFVPPKELLNKKAPSSDDEFSKLPNDSKLSEPLKEKSREESDEDEPSLKSPTKLDQVKPFEKIEDTKQTTQTVTQSIISQTASFVKETIIDGKPKFDDVKTSEPSKEMSIDKAPSKSPSDDKLSELPKDLKLTEPLKEKSREESDEDEPSLKSPTKLEQVKPFEKIEDTKQTTQTVTQSIISQTASFVKETIIDGKPKFDDVKKSEPSKEMSIDKAPSKSPSDDKLSELPKDLKLTEPLKEKSREESDEDEPSLKSPTKLDQVKPFEKIEDTKQTTQTVTQSIISQTASFVKETIIDGKPKFDDVKKSEPSKEMSIDKAPSKSPSDDKLSELPKDLKLTEPLKEKSREESDEDEPSLKSPTKLDQVKPFEKIEDTKQTTQTVTQSIISQTASFVKETIIDGKPKFDDVKTSEPSKEMSIDKAPSKSPSDDKLSELPKDLKLTEPLKEKSREESDEDEPSLKSPTKLDQVKPFEKIEDTKQTTQTVTQSIISQTASFVKETIIDGKPKFDDVKTSEPSKEMSIDKAPSKSPSDDKLSELPKDLKLSEPLKEKSREESDEDEPSLKSPTKLDQVKPFEKIEDTKQTTQTVTQSIISQTASFVKETIVDGKPKFDDVKTSEPSKEMSIDKAPSKSPSDDKLSELPKDLKLSEPLKEKSREESDEDEPSLKSPTKLDQVKPFEKIEDTKQTTQTVTQSIISQTASFVKETIIDGKPKFDDVKTSEPSKETSIEKAPSKSPSDDKLSELPKDSKISEPLKEKSREESDEDEPSLKSPTKLDQVKPFEKIEDTKQTTQTVTQSIISQTASFVKETIIDGKPKFDDVKTSEPSKEMSIDKAPSKSPSDDKLSELPKDLKLSEPLKEKSREESDEDEPSLKSPTKLEQVKPFEKIEDTKQTTQTVTQSIISQTASFVKETIVDGKPKFDDVKTSEPSKEMSIDKAPSKSPSDDKLSELPKDLKSSEPLKEKSREESDEDEPSLKSPTKLDQVKPFEKIEDTKQTTQTVTQSIISQTASFVKETIIDGKPKFDDVKTSEPSKEIRLKKLRQSHPVTINYLNCRRI